MTKLKEVGTKKRKRGCLASSLISRAREREREKECYVVCEHKKDRLLFRSEFNGIKQGLGERKKRRKSKR